MNELIEKINEILTGLNNTFELEANIVEEDGEKIANGLKIKSIKNDGSEFMNSLIDIFSQIVEATGENEIVYDEEKGIVIAKPTTITEYKNI